MLSAIERYIETQTSRMRVDDAQRAAIARNLRARLAPLAAEAEVAGLNRDAAEREAVFAFSQPTVQLWRPLAALLGWNGLALDRLFLFACIILIALAVQVAGLNAPDIVAGPALVGLLALATIIAYAPLHRRVQFDGRLRIHRLLRRARPVSICSPRSAAP